MNDQQRRVEEIRPGDDASIENRGDAGLPISILTGGGTHIDLELAPGQAIELVAGEQGARVVVRADEAADLLVVKPGTP